MARIIVLLLIIAVIVGLVWALRRQGGRSNLRSRLLGCSTGQQGRGAAATKPGGMEKLRDNPMFWGVEMGQPGCEAAQALLGQQFTFDEAPQLPLEGCNSANCTCQFKGLKDRRSMVRRLQEDRREALRFDKDRPPDRRSRKDRRRGNVWIDHDY
jgi:hypothetical protein